MNKTQKIFEAVVVIIGMILVAVWLWVAISISGAPSSGDRSPNDCITPAGDPC